MIITIDTDAIKYFFTTTIPAYVFCFFFKYFTTKRRKRIITIWLLRKDLRYTREARRAQLDRMFGREE